MLRGFCHSWTLTVLLVFIGPTIRTRSWSWIRKILKMWYGHGHGHIFLNRDTDMDHITWSWSRRLTGVEHTLFVDSSTRQKPMLLVLE